MIKPCELKQVKEIEKPEITKVKECIIEKRFSKKHISPVFSQRKNLLRSLPYDHTKQNKHNKFRFYFHDLDGLLRIRNIKISSLFVWNSLNINSLVTYTKIKQFFCGWISFNPFNSYFLLSSVDFAA